MDKKSSKMKGSLLMIDQGLWDLNGSGQRIAIEEDIRLSLTEMKGQEVTGEGGAFMLTDGD